MNITIHVNNSKREIDNERIPDLDALVKFLLEKNQGIIAEVNEQIINRNSWKEYKLQEGDKIELVKFVGGG
jgi:sulfur carrier protein